MIWRFLGVVATPGGLFSSQQFSEALGGGVP
ncbi:hypothetical protein SAMN05216281_12150, partial [Cryobacterium luteum]